MKKQYLYRTTLLLIVLVISNSCRKALKNVDDYLPKVSIVSAVIQADGSVKVTGQIDSKGYSEVEEAGFSCNTTPEPRMLDRQAMAEIDGNTFTATYNGFDKDSTYYFRCWATNRYGYRFGNVVSLNNIIAPAVTPTCTLTANYLDRGDGGGATSYFNVTAPTSSSQYWNFSASASSGYPVNFTFGSAVTTGIYTTEKSSSPSSGKVFVYFNVGFNTYSLESGTPVYVNTVGSAWEITICNAPWKPTTSSTFYFKTRFLTPY